MIRKFIFILILKCVFVKGVIASINADNSITQIPPNDICTQVVYYYDSTNKLLPNDLLSEKFTKWKVYNHNSDLPPATNIWIKTQYVNHTDTIQYQYFGFEKFDFATCYIFKDNDKCIDTLNAGQLLGPKYLSYNIDHTTFKIPILPQQRITVLVRFYNMNTGTHTNYHFYLRTEVEALKHILNTLNYNKEFRYFNLMFVGALSIVALFFFCQYLQQRTQYIFLLYVCYLTFIVLHASREFFRFRGLQDAQAVFTNWYYYSEIPLAYGIYILYTLIFIFLLDLKKLNGFAYKYARLVLVLFVINLLLDIYLKIFHSIPLSYTFFYFLRLPLLILTWPILIFSFKSRSASANYFFYGSLILLIGVVFNIVMSSLQRFEQFHFLLNKDESSNFWKSYIVYSRIGMLMEVLFFSLGLAHKSKLEHAAASNDALKSNFALMINHSVSNALNKLKGMIKRKEEGVIPYIDETGDMMQNMLSVVRNQITLTQELILANQFFEFRNEQTEKIKFNVNVSDCITENYYLPPMLLQPFIENCIEHAWNENEIEKKIEINIVAQNKFATIEIIDNGNGIVENNRKEKSHGMILIAERIKYFNSIFVCDITFQIANSKIKKGTTVTIKNIPQKKC